MGPVDGVAKFAELSLRGNARHRRGRGGEARCLHTDLVICSTLGPPNLRESQVSQGPRLPRPRECQYPSPRDDSRARTLENMFTC